MSLVHLGRLSFAITSLYVVYELVHQFATNMIAFIFEGEKQSWKAWPDSEDIFIADVTNHMAAWGKTAIKLTLRCHYRCRRKNKLRSFDKSWSYLHICWHWTYRPFRYHSHDIAPPFRQNDRSWEPRQVIREIFTLSGPTHISDLS